MKQFLSLTGGAKFFALFFVMLSFCTTNVQAQCPASIDTTSTVVTTATCPSNGAFTINPSVPGTGGSNPPYQLTYQITAAPAGYTPPVGVVNTNTFNSLSPGTYTVKIACDINPAISKTINITVPSTYVNVDATSVVTNVCSSANLYGTITTTATGSSAPFSYAYWQGDPAQADGSTVYQTINTNSTTNSYTPTAFGKYNVRVKDACGVIVTQEISVEKTFPSGLVVTYPGPKRDILTCAQLADSIYLQLNFSSNLANLPAQGVDVDIYENTGNCTKGAFVKTVHVDAANPAPLVLLKKLTDYIFVTKTPCGDENVFCYNYSSVNQPMSVNFSMNAKGCQAAPGDPINYSIFMNAGINYSLPLKVVITNSVGDTLPGTPYRSVDAVHEFTNVPSGTYTVTATDTCGQMVTYTLAPPTGAVNDLTAVVSTNIACSLIEGKTTLFVIINGVMANLVNATATIIAESPAQTPSLVGLSGLLNAGLYEWQNATPGTTYTIKVDNGCGAKDTVTVTLPTGVPVVDQHITATVQQLCGGIGNIIIEATNNGYGTYSYDIKNSSNITVATGTVPGGTYTNLPAGDYTVNDHMLGCGPFNHTKTVTILPDGSGPVITKKLGVICEDGSGNPTTTGSALLSFVGAKPFKVEYRLKSGTDADYLPNPPIKNTSGTETITGLTANTSYMVRITDACGNGAITEVAIGKLTPLATENTLQPCENQPYTLSVPDMVNATYSWTKDGNPISTARSINFTPFQSGDNGTYVCTAIIAGCVTRTITVKLNSVACGQTLPVKLVAFNATAAGTKALLSWVTSSEQNAKGFGVQRSADAVNWNEIGYVASKAPNGTSTQQLHYSFYDNSPLQNANYYRLRQTDLDGKQTLSDTRKVVFGKNDEVSIFPNPANKGIWITTSSAYENKAATINLYSFDGKLVLSQKVSALSSSQYIDVSKLMTGKYAVRILMNNEVINKTIQIIK